MERDVKPIVGFPGYLVSNYGEVYSTLSRSVDQFPKLMRAIPANGRWVVGLRRDGKRHVVKIHTLVLTTFVGPRPHGMNGCHFPDRDTRNNRLDNLRWDTPKSNQADRVFHQTTNDGEKNGSAKLTRQDVVEIRRRHANGEMYSTLSAYFNVSPAAIRFACIGATWKTIQEG